MKTTMIILTCVMTLAFIGQTPASGAITALIGDNSSSSSEPPIYTMPIYDPLAPVKQAVTGQSAAQATLVYGGGPIQKATQFYLCYWGWTSDPSNVKPYAEAFFNGVGGSPWIGNDNQYSSSSQGFITNPTGQLKGVWSDTTSVPTKPTQTAVNNAGIRCKNHFGYNADATYAVATPSGHSQSGFGTQWCAYHEALTSNGVKVAVAYLPYTPDAGASCGKNFVNANGPLDGVSITWGHEYEEAKSDPVPCTGWCTPGGSENADECAWKKPPAADITLSTGTFAVQGLWSNAANACVIQ